MKIVTFIRYIRRLRLQLDYNKCDIIACDETPLWFEDVGSTTVNKSGVKEIPILSAKHEKMRCTVMLSAKADGKKLKPFVVLKRC